MRLNGTLHYRETKAATARTSRDERLKETISQLFGNAGAGVPHFEPQRVLDVVTEREDLPPWPDQW